MLKENIMTIIHIAIPLIAAFTSAYFANRFSIGREDRNHKRSLEILKIQDFNKAAFDFREAFMAEYLALSPAKYALKTNLSDFLENSLDKHRIAICRFSHYLSPQDRIGLDNAWYEYHCHEDGRSKEIVPHYGQYSLENEGLSTKQKHDVKKLAKSRIDKILNFAKPK